jgi:hypothetical protein
MANTFTLASGRKVVKDATHGVAVKSRGRWSHRWYRSRKGAENELKSLRAMRPDTIAYYGIESYRMIVPDPA